MNRRHDRGFCYVRVLRKYAFDLRGAETMSGDVDHVIDPTGDPIVPVEIPYAAIPGEVETLVLTEVCLDEPPVVVKDRPGETRNWLSDTQYLHHPQHIRYICTY